MASVCEPIVHAEAGNREGSISSERRESERFRCNWYPTVGFLARAKNLATGRGVIRDVSGMGMGLISEQILEPGTLIAIQRSKQNGFSDVLSAEISAHGASRRRFMLARLSTMAQPLKEEMGALLM